MWVADTPQTWKTNKKREEWVANAKSGHESDQREKKLCDVNKNRKITSRSY